VKKLFAFNTLLQKRNLFSWLGMLWTTDEVLKAFETGVPLFALGRD
jgi:hypothetical protein